MSDCGHGMPSPAACTDCMDEGPLPRAKLARDGWPFAAKLAGTCGGCTAGVEEGERIVRMSDGAYHHVGHCEKVRRQS